MGLERRLHEHLPATGDGVPERGDRLAAVSRRGRRRRVVQNSVIGVACLALVIGAGIGLRSGTTTRVAFEPGSAPPGTPASSQTAAAGTTTAATDRPEPSEAPGSEASPDQVDTVAMEDLGAPVLAYGGRTPDLRVYREDGGLLIRAGAIDMAIADSAGGLVVQSERTISWFPEADPRTTTTLVRSNDPLTLRAMLPDGRVLYSVADTERSEDMVERYFAVALTDAAAPDLMATDAAYEHWSIGPAETADGSLIMAGCHMVCSIYPWPRDDTMRRYPEAVYHGDGGDQGANAAIEGLTATPDGRVIAMVEYYPTPTMAPPELVVLDGTSLHVVATVILPVDKDRSVGRADVSLAADGQRVLVSVESRRDDVDAVWRRDTFLVEGATTNNPQVRRVDFDGVVRWLEPGGAS